MTKQETNALPDMLDRLKAGGTPETAYELLFHRAAYGLMKAIVKKAAEAREATPEQLDGIEALCLADNSTLNPLVLLSELR